MKTKNNYITPSIEIISVVHEQGYASTGTVENGNSSVGNESATENW